MPIYIHFKAFNSFSKLLPIIKIQVKIENTKNNRLVEFINMIQELGLIVFFYVLNNLSIYLYKSGHLDCLID